MFYEAIISAIPKSDEYIMNWKDTEGWQSEIDLKDVILQSAGNIDKDVYEIGIDVLPEDIPDIRTKIIHCLSEIGTIRTFFAHVTRTPSSPYPYVHFSAIVEKD